MIRVATLVAVCAVPGACSAREGNGNSMTPDTANVASVRLQDAPRGTAQQRIVISSDQGRITAELVDNDATMALVRMLPFTLEMRDHLRQEKTGNLPSPLPDAHRQTEFSAGTLGLWGTNDFVLYYRSGQVPRPGIIVLGRVTGDLSYFDHPEPVMVRIERAE